MSLPDIQSLSVEQLQAELANALVVRTNFLQADNRTYLYAKLCAAMKKPNSLGGGNFPIAASGLACLEYYALIHEHLTGGKGLWTQPEIAKWKKAYEKATKELSSNERGLVIKPAPNLGDVKQAATPIWNLLQAFEKSGGVPSGLPTDFQKMQKVWGAFRNHLAHTMSPAFGCSATAYDPADVPKCGFTKTNLAKGIALQPISPFSQSASEQGTAWMLSADYLALGYLPYITEFLLHILAEPPSTDCLRSALKYAWGTEFKP